MPRHHACCAQHTHTPLETTLKICAHTHRPWPHTVQCTGVAHLVAARMRRRILSSRMTRMMRVWDAAAWMRMRYKRQRARGGEEGGEVGRPVAERAQARATAAAR